MGKTRRGLKYEVQDKHYHAAKERGFVARSALKLEELDKKHRIYGAGMKILDLGCAPGSWLQYASKKSGPMARLWGIDLDPVRVDLPNVVTAVGDIYDLKADDERLKDYLPFDLIQSDAMTKTVGVSDADCAKSVALAEYAVWLAEKGVLKEGGALLCKVFEGPGFTPFYTALKRKFRRCTVNKPDSIRKGSREVYVYAEEFRPALRDIE